VTTGSQEERNSSGQARKEHRRWQAEEEGTVASLLFYDFVF